MDDVKSTPKRWSFAWKRSLLLIGWWQPLLGLLGMVVLGMLAQARDPSAQMIGLSAVAGIGALVGGTQAAFIFAPADEPALELLISAPRPVYYLLLERLTVLVIMNVAIALIGTFLFTLINNAQGTEIDQLVRWISPFILLVGLGMLIGIATQRSSYGALLVILLNGGTVLGGYGVISRFEIAKYVFPYLPPGMYSDEVYFLNRVILIALGLLFMGMTFRMLRNDEKLLAAQVNAV